MAVEQPRIALFCYNMPHKKTQDFLLRLFLEDIKINTVFAADWIKLNIPPSTLRIKIRHEALVHPAKIAKRIGAEYLTMPHNSPDTVEAIKNRRLDLGIISGARILKPEVINSFSIGIINFHPGLIPQARGLDAMLWSIYYDIPLGVTAHLIDERVDAGQIVLQERIAVYEDDTLLDLYERIQEKQVDLIQPAVVKALRNEWSETDCRTPYRRKMSVELERRVVQKLPDYLQRHKESET